MEEKKNLQTLGKKGILIKMLYILLCIIILILYIRYLENKILFHPSRDMHSTPADRAIPFEDVFFPSGSQLKLHGWFIPAPDAEYTLLFLHGNAGNICDRLDKIGLFYRMGINIFIIDYRGYGQSQGSPSEQGLYEDTIAAYDYLLTRSDINKDGIIAYGVSLGGAMAVDVASQRKFAGLILDSTLSRGRDMARLMFPFLPGFMIRTKLDSQSKINAVEAPKLFIHAQDDEMVPYALGQKLFQAANPPKRFVTLTGGHNDGWASSLTVWNDNVKEFIHQLSPKKELENERIPQSP